MLSNSARFVRSKHHSLWRVPRQSPLLISGREAFQRSATAALGHFIAKFTSIARNFAAVPKGPFPVQSRARSARYPGASGVVPDKAPPVCCTAVSRIARKPPIKRLHMPVQLYSHFIDEPYIDIHSLPARPHHQASTKRPRSFTAATWVTLRRDPATRSARPGPKPGSAR